MDSAPTPVTPVPRRRRDVVAASMLERLFGLGLMIPSYFLSTVYNLLFIAAAVDRARVLQVDATDLPCSMVVVVVFTPGLGRLKRGNIRIIYMRESEINFHLLIRIKHFIFIGFSVPPKVYIFGIINYNSFYPNPVVFGDFFGDTHR